MIKRYRLKPRHKILIASEYTDRGEGIPLEYYHWPTYKLISRDTKNKRMKKKFDIADQCCYSILLKGMEEYYNKK